MHLEAVVTSIVDRSILLTDENKNLWKSIIILLFKKKNNNIILICILLFF